MNKPNFSAAQQEVKSENAHCSPKDGLMRRAQQELAYAMGALQQAGALFAAIEKAYFADADKDAIFLLAQIGIETTGYQAERAESESDFFSDECNHA
jgi:hypothetical protein